jgi:hypothetical protein
MGKGISPKKMSIASTGEKYMENYYIANEKYDREYIRSTWDMATGLQAVDSLTPSDYLKELAVKNIEGELSNDEIEELLYSNYKDEDSGEVRSRIKEADIVSNRIVKLLKSESFSFSVVTLNIYIKNYLKIFTILRVSLEVITLVKGKHILRNRDLILLCPTLPCETLL